MADDTPWLLLIHQVPPKPDYLRVKIGRRLQRIGAVAVKNSVYVLPYRPSSLEDFQWIRTEIVDSGGEASICQAAFVDGLTDAYIEQIFRDASDANYAEVAEAARQLRSTMRRGAPDPVRSSAARVDDDLARLRKRFATIATTDFFEAPGRAMAEEALRSIADALTPPQSADSVAPRAARTEYRGKTWVTRKGVFIDRMSSAWLIRRFIDRDARFKFVANVKYKPVRSELRFDMFEGEFTHEADRCTFENLLDRFHLDDAALRAIGEIVHDIDMKDEKFTREDAAGIERVFAGIAAASTDDMTRVDRASQILDDLYSLITTELQG